MSSNLIVLIYIISFAKILGRRNCLHIADMYDEAKVNTVLIHDFTSNAVTKRAILMRGRQDRYD